jgi:hypothetical protein
MYSKWFSEYHKLHPDIQINYQSIGSGGGIRQVINGTVDFGASDGPMTDDMLKEAKTKILHMPTVLGRGRAGLQHSGSDGGVKFTPDSLAGIFLGKITKWNDKAITSANPGVNFPDKDIIVVHRSDGSGTTYIWTDYLSKISPEWQKPGGDGHVREVADRAGRKRKRRRCRFDPAVTGIDRLRGIDLRRAKQHQLWQRKERGGKFCEGLARQCDGSCGFGAQNAGGLSSLHYERAGKRCVSDFQLYLAVDSCAIERCGERENPGRFSQLDGYRWTKNDGGAFLCSAPGRRCSEREGRNQASSIVQQGNFHHSFKNKESVMNSVWKWCAILFLATTVVAQTSTPPKAKKASPRR